MAEAIRELAPPGGAAGRPAAGEPRQLPSLVPLRGLPFIALALLLLLVVLVGNWLWALDFVHVTAGALWTSLDLVLGFVIGPILRRLPVPARMEFQKRFMPAMLLIMPTVVIMTLAAGFQLARLTGDLAAPATHAWIVASFGVVGVMTVVALGVLQPANLAVLFEMRKPRPDGQLIGTLMRRYLYTAGVTGLMQVATLVIMTRLATL
jgi:hypothetical protein